MIAEGVSSGWDEQSRRRRHAAEAAAAAAEAAEGGEGLALDGYASASDDGLVRACMHAWTLF